MTEPSCRSAHRLVAVYEHASSKDVAKIKEKANIRQQAASDDRLDEATPPRWQDDTRPLRLIAGHARLEALRRCEPDKLSEQRMWPADVYEYGENAASTSRSIRRADFVTQMSPSATPRSSIDAPRQRVGLRFPEYRRRFVLGVVARCARRRIERTSPSQRGGTTRSALRLTCRLWRAEIAGVEKAVPRSAAHVRTAKGLLATKQYPSLR